MTSLKKEAFNFEVKFAGGLEAQNSELNLYDLSVALRGIHRSFTIIGNYIATDQIITRVPDAKGINILSYPAEEGSFLVRLAIVFTIAGVFLEKAVTQPRDTVLGNLTWSCYEYVIHKATGLKVSYDTTIFDEWYREKGKPEHKVESLVQKVESSLYEIHRPIQTNSAHEVILKRNTGSDGMIRLNTRTFDVLNKWIYYDDNVLFYGRVSSYNANTHTGMVYVESEMRAIPFEFDKSVTVDDILITKSLSLYARSKKHTGKLGFFEFQAKKVCTANGVLKKLRIANVYPKSLVSQ